MIQLQRHLAGSTIKEDSKLVTSTVILQFPNIQWLWRFRLAIAARRCIVQTASRTLICSCSKEHIVLAITHYQAILLAENRKVSKEGV